MFYAFSKPADEVWTGATSQNLLVDLTLGIIHQVDVLFQDGCNHEIFVRIFQGDHQLWPTNRGAELRGNATVVSFREFYKLTSGNTDLTIKFRSTLTGVWPEVIIQIGILPERILQPLSFKELLAAASGV